MPMGLYLYTVPERGKYEQSAGVLFLVLPKSWPELLVHFIIIMQMQIAYIPWWRVGIY